MQKITITGTKGKTTVAYLVSEVLRLSGENVVRVDTTGHYINGQQRSTLQDAKDTWGLVPTVSPGKYLYEFLENPVLKNGGVAVLEAALGSSGSAGLGYRTHQVGVFLNVFEDHLGVSKRLKTRADIAKAKQFVFSRIDRDGWVVFNADEKLIVEKLEVIPEAVKGVKLLPCGIKFSEFNITKHLAEGGRAFTVEEGWVVLLEADKKTKLVNLKNIPWAFGGEFLPSAWNIMMSAAAVYAKYEGVWSKRITDVFESVRLDPYGGRLTALRAANGMTILADYAHEKVSLAEVAKLGRTMLGPGGKLIGVVRLAHDRTDAMMRETGLVVGKSYDECVVYDKIDGFYKKPKKTRTDNYPQVVGRTSKVFAAGIKETNPHVTRILREDQALEHAAKIASPNDVVVCIVNDDIKQSIGFIKKAFTAEFV